MYYICTAIKKVLPIHYNLREIIFKPILYLKQNYRLWKCKEVCSKPSFYEERGCIVCCGYVALCH